MCITRCRRRSHACVGGHGAGAEILLRAVVTGVRHATADVAGNANLARSWSRWVRRWPAGAQSDPLEATRASMRPCCCGPTATATTRWPGRGGARPAARRAAAGAAGNGLPDRLRRSRRRRARAEGVLRLNAAERVHDRIAYGHPSARAHRSLPPHGVPYRLAWAGGEGARHARYWRMIMTLRNTSWT